MLSDDLAIPNLIQTNLEYKEWIQKKHQQLKEKKRKQRGGIDGTVMFPVAPPKVELPADYSQFLTDLKQRIRSERLRVILASNTAMILLYWDIFSGD